MLSSPLISEIILGLRLSAFMLWATVLARCLTESWDVTKCAEAVRIRAWNYWRAAIIIMALSILAFFTAADILYLSNMINLDQSRLARIGGISLICISGSLILTGFDITKGGGRLGLLAYVAISCLGPIYVLARHM